MSINALDVSEYQGDIDWTAVEEPIAIIKMSGGDAGLYVDAKANRNYYGAKAAGKAIGMYHFAGGKDAVNEADFFIAACSPLEEGDVMILDWELSNQIDPVGWCHAFIQRVIDRTHTVPLIYMSASRLVADRDPNGNVRSLDWTPVVNQNVGLWVAHYGVSPDDNVELKWWKQYVMHQYTGTGSTAGVSGEVDKDVWFGTVDQFKAYGFHNPASAESQSQPVPDPVVAVPAPVDQPDSTPETAPEPAEAPASADDGLDDLDYGNLDMEHDPAPQTKPDPTPAPVVVPATQVVHVPVDNLKATILTAITAVMAAIAAVLAWLHS